MFCLCDVRYSGHTITKTEFRKTVLSTAKLRLSLHIFVCTHCENHFKDGMVELSAFSVSVRHQQDACAHKLCQIDNLLSQKCIMYAPMYIVPANDKSIYRQSKNCLSKHIDLHLCSPRISTYGISTTYRRHVFYTLTHRHRAMFIDLLMEGKAVEQKTSKFPMRWQGNGERTKKIYLGSSFLLLLANFDSNSIQI